MRPSSVSTVARSESENDAVFAACDFDETDDPMPTASDDP